MSCCKNWYLELFCLVTLDTIQFWFLRVYLVGKSQGLPWPVFPLLHGQGFTKSHPDDRGSIGIIDQRAKTHDGQARQLKTTGHDNFMHMTGKGYTDLIVWEYIYIYICIIYIYIYL